MLVGIGCDIVEHDLTRDLKWENSMSIQQRIFSQEELDIYYLEKDITFLTGRFAVKEAVLKCLGIGMQDGISLTDIHVLKSALGAPILELKGYVKDIANNIGVNKWHISITHSSNFTVALVIAES